MGHYQQQQIGAAPYPVAPYPAAPYPPSPYPPQPAPAPTQPANQSNVYVYPGQPATAPSQPANEANVYVNVSRHHIGGYKLGSKPQIVYCPNCKKNNATRIVHIAGLATWIFVIICLFLGCWLGCCLIPFCVEDCQDCHHYCSRCNEYVGRFKRIS